MDPGSPTVGEPPAPVVPRAERPGDLGSLPAGLPPGNLLLGRDPYRDGDEGVPVLWCSSGPGEYQDLFGRLAADFTSTGLWPLVLPVEGHELPSDDVLGRPQPVADVDAVLDRLGVSPVGLPPPRRGGSPAIPAGPVWLMLVPATRPADVPAALGWMGPVNHDLGGAEVSAVLRSWEDRLGAFVVGVGFDTLLVTLPHPAPEDAVPGLAREHYAFCPDNIDQGAGSIEAYFPVVRSGQWPFWWD